MNKEEIIKVKEGKVSLKIDFIFKDVFSNNEKLLIDLLEGILGYQIEKIKIIQDYALNKSKKEEKKGILDLKATLPNGDIVNIEMQVQDKKNTVPRMQFYGSKLFNKEIKSGDDYKTSKPVICIAILDYLVHKNQEHYLAKTKTNFIKINNEGKYIYEDEMKDFIQLITIELPTFRKMEHDPNNKLDQWLTIIEKNDLSEIEVVMKNNENIKKALSELYKLEATPKVLAEIEKLEDDLRNYNDGMRSAAEEGAQQQLKETVRKLCEKEFSVEQISKMLDIDVETLESLLS